MSQTKVIAANGIPCALLKEWWPTDLFKLGVGISAAGALDLKQTGGTIFTSDPIDISGLKEFKLAVISDQTGTPNAATMNFRADFYTEDGSIYAANVDIALVTVGITTNQNQYTWVWSAAIAATGLAAGTSPGTIAAGSGGTGSIPTFWRGISTMKLKGIVGTASTATTSTLKVFFAGAT